MAKTAKRICVLGDGSWGRALASLAQAGGHQVSVWSRKAPATLGVEHADALVVALPAQVVGSVLKALPVRPGTDIIIAAKGIERGSHRFMHEVVRDVLPFCVPYILSGPSFAADVLKKLPTAVTLAGDDAEKATQWARELSLPAFRIYGSDDLVGVALGGSLKNVLAIACGISDGHGLGESARAALIARSFSELTRLGKALGAKPPTLMGLSGLGDLLLTSASQQSRNYAFGHRVGSGLGLAAALEQSSGVVEGVYSAEAAVWLATRHNVEMPITQAVHAIVDQGSSPESEVEKLLARPVGREFQ